MQVQQVVLMLVACGITLVTPWAIRRLFFKNYFDS